VSSVLVGVMKLTFLGQPVILISANSDR